MPSQPRDFSQFGPPRRVTGGITARTQRGSFGRTWWGRELLAAVDRLADSGRMSRGRSYARAGQVIAFEIVRGNVRAQVQGSQPRPFRADFSIATFSDSELGRLAETVRAAPGMLAKLAGGVVPQELAPLLLPEERHELDFDCTCPDDGWPCKHVAAVVYLLVERIDEQPMELLRLRGVDFDWLANQVSAIGAAENDDDFFGDEIALPPLPRPELRPALDDLDVGILRRALREISDSERQVSATLADLSALYRQLG